MIYFQKKIFTMFKELFGAACSKPPPLGIPVSPQSRAMYAIDLMLDWAIKPNGMHMYSSKFTWITRMHSSRMRTACSSSRLGGVYLSACWDTPQVWAWRPPSQTPQLPPGCEPGDPPPRPDPSTFPLGVGLETCRAYWDTTPPPPLPARHAGIPPPPPPDRILDTRF